MTDATTKGGKGRRMIMAAVAAAAACGLGAAAFVLLPEGATAGSAPAADVEDASSAPLEATLLEEFVVDIATVTTSGRTRTRFLKADIAIVHPATDRTRSMIEARRHHLRDAYVDYLRQLGADDVSGSAGLARMRADLLLRARALLGPDVPREVLLADLVLQ